jgi:Kef-type K+ transport system membrane component KefB
MHHADIILEIAIAIVAASVLALAARAARQPLILAYLAAVWVISRSKTSSPSQNWA